MSRARRESDRIALDAYMTPPWAVDVILPFLPLTNHTTVLEPCCGTGNVLERVRAHGVESASLRGIEIDAGRADTARARGFNVETANALSADWGSPDVIITNPPYRRALEFATKAVEVARGKGTVALLLRLGFLETLKRREWHVANPCDLFVFPRRPSFFGSGSDGAAYGWFVWAPCRGNRYWVLDAPTARNVASQSPGAVAVAPVAAQPAAT